MKHFLGYQRLMYACRNTVDKQGIWIVLFLLPLTLLSPYIILILCSLISSTMLDIRKKQSSGLVLLPVSDSFELVNHYAFGFVWILAGAIIDSLILMIVYGLTFGILDPIIQDLVEMYASKPWENIICFSFAVSIYMVNVMLMRVIYRRKHAWVVFMILTLSGFVLAIILPRETGFAYMSLMIMFTLLILCPWISYLLKKRGVLC